MSQQVNWDFGRASPTCSKPDLLKNISWRYVSTEQFACASQIHVNITVGTTVHLPLGSSDPCSLRCDATGYPEPTVAWFRHAHRVEDTIVVSSRQQQQQPLGAGLLVRYDDVIHVTSCVRLLNATQSVAGDYQCVANNSAGRSEFNFKLYVIDAVRTPIMSIVLADNRGTNQSEGASIRLQVALGATGGAFLLTFIVALFVICLVRHIDRDKRAYKVRDHERRRSEEKQREGGAACTQSVDQNTSHCDESEDNSCTTNLMSNLQKDQNIKQLASLLFLSNGGCDGGGDECHRSYVDDETVGNQQSDSTESQYNHFNQTIHSHLRANAKISEGGDQQQLRRTGSLGSLKRVVLIQFDQESPPTPYYPLFPSEETTYDEINIESQKISNTFIDQQYSSTPLHTSELSPVCPATSVTPDLLNNSILDAHTKNAGIASSHDYSYRKPDKQRRSHRTPIIAAALRWKQKNHFRSADIAAGISYRCVLPSVLKPPTAASQGTENKTNGALSEKISNGITITPLQSSTPASGLQDLSRTLQTNNDKLTRLSNPHKDRQQYDDVRQCSDLYDPPEVPRVVPQDSPSVSSSSDCSISVRYSRGNFLSATDLDWSAVASSVSSTPSDTPQPSNQDTPAADHSSYLCSSAAFVAAAAYTADFGCYHIRDPLSSHGCINTSPFLERPMAMNHGNMRLLRNQSRVAVPVQTSGPKICNRLPTVSDCCKRFSTLTRTDYHRAVAARGDSVTSQAACVTSESVIANTMPRDTPTSAGKSRVSTLMRITLPESIAGFTDGLYPRPPPKPVRTFQHYELIPNVNLFDPPNARLQQSRRHTNPHSWITNC